MTSSEFDLMEFFEKTPDFVCIADKEGYFKKINPAVVTKLEYSKEELFSQPISSFIHPEDKEMTSHWRSKLMSGKPLLNFENRYVSKSGNIVWLEWTSIYIPDKEVVFAIAKDVTARKQAQEDIEEKYLKYQTLATHFKRSMEEDKKYLAAELHEQLAQLASVVKFDIDWMKSNVPDLSAAWKNKIEHAFTITEMLVNTIQRISFSISPKMLEDLGLDATLEWYCNEFETLAGIPCRFECNYEPADLSGEVMLDFFRICQDALTNIMHHSQAQNVIISITDAGDRINLSIFDDGIEANTHQHNNKRSLARLKERAASINAEITVKNEIGVGTMVSVSIGKGKAG